MPPPPPPLVTRIEPLGPRGLRFLVHLERGDPLEVTLEALERAHVGVGDPLPRHRREHLLDQDAEVRVRDAALSLLSHRARTRAELARRLRQKGFGPGRIATCLDRLEEKGFLDDEAVAAAHIRDRLRHRPRGAAALAAELRAKGLTGELVDQTIERVFDDEETSDAELAGAVAEKWVARQSAALLAALTSESHSTERDKAHRRLRGYLARRGFRGDELRLGVARALEVARGSE